MRSRVDVREGNYTVERRLPVYGHATVRYRFRPDSNGNVWSIGVGSPLIIFWERNRPRIWDSPADAATGRARRVGFLIWSAGRGLR